ncbi:MAG TPA: hypothetical protein PKY87_16235 [Terricaulis sp.]|nr:hypothetical protein [Terricaulis sp.]
MLKVLREGLSYSAAAQRAGIARATLYRYMDDDEGFKKACQDAYETGTDALEDEAQRRGVRGVRRMKFYKGQPIMVPNPDDPDGDPIPYTEHEYSDTLLQRQLDARRPEKYRANHKVEHSGEVKLSFDRDDGEL